MDTVLIAFAAALLLSVFLGHALSYGLYYLTTFTKNPPSADSPATSSTKGPMPADLPLEFSSGFSSGTTARPITLEQLAQIEASLPRLFQVIVVAHEVDKPLDQLQAAVEANFLNGVCYLFLISRSSAERHQIGYYDIFEALARIAMSRARTPIPIDTLVKIQHFDYDWDDYPYIFYQMRETTGVRTIALRGTDIREGIAKSYELVDPRSAQTIARSIVASAPQSLDLTASQFREDPRKVISITSHRERRSVISGDDE
jgi:hypothetical protein